MAWLRLSVDPKGFPCRELGQQCGALEMVETSLGGPHEGGEVAKALL